MTRFSRMCVVAGALLGFGCAAGVAKPVYTLKQPTDINQLMGAVALALMDRGYEVRAEGKEAIATKKDKTEDEKTLGSIIIRPQDDGYVVDTDAPSPEGRVCEEVADQMKDAHEHVGKALQEYSGEELAVLGQSLDKVASVMVTAQPPTQGCEAIAEISASVWGASGPFGAPNLEKHTKRVRLKLKLMAIMKGANHVVASPNPMMAPSAFATKFTLMGNGYRCSK